MRRFQMLVVLLAAAMSAACAKAPAARKVRQAAVAGGFYPADAGELAKMIDGFLAAAKPPEIREPILALISPHAGYVYSGAVAAQGYALLKGRKIERVVVLSPSHVDSFRFAAVYDGEAYGTPLGSVAVDKAFGAKLAAGQGLIKLSGRGHETTGERGEHALEVQLPFLQRALGEFKLVPIIMGDQSYEICRTLGLALAREIRGPETLIVASSDLSHFHSYEDAVKLDRRTLRAVEEYDYLSLWRNLEQRVWEACGGGPIVAAMIAAERMGGAEARLLKYANSGDVTGDRSRVVGYGSAVVVKAGPARSPRASTLSLTPAEKDELLKLARKSVETAVMERRLYEGPAPESEALLADRGAFVTLKKRGELRGCIGYISPSKPLWMTVREVAALAAVRDGRFPPVTAPELGELTYEISVLSPMKRMPDAKAIQVGRHGLVVKRGDQEGLLLPQVATEQGWDAPVFLEQTCRKAGLAAGAWKDAETDVFLFSALVFGEHTGAPPVSSVKRAR